MLRRQKARHTLQRCLLPRRVGRSSKPRHALQQCLLTRRVVRITASLDALSAAQRLMQGIPDLLRARVLLAPGAAADAYHSIFEVREDRSRCVAPAPLAAKYGVSADNAQAVVTVRNRFSGQATFWNPARTAKPQTFTAVREAVEDPTAGKACDFCSWREFTAADTFGRVENAHAVSASNLFKISKHHGMVLFKHHDPLAFSEEQLAGLLEASQGWVHAAAAAHPEEHPLHPLLIWNALPRSGASQFHGHVQLLLHEQPLPDIARATATAAAFAKAHPSRSGLYAADLAAAHGALGLRRTLSVAGDVATAYACIAPYKDCECVVHGASATSPAFVRLLHVAMRALIDRCGITSFNACVLGMSITAAEAPAEAGEGGGAGLVDGVGVTARVVSRGKATSRASDFGALEVFGDASIGHTSPWAVAAAFDAEAGARSIAWTLSGSE